MDYSERKLEFSQFKPNIPMIQNRMYRADFWINYLNVKDEIIMANEKIEKHFGKLTVNKEFEEMMNYQVILTRKEKINKIMSISKKPASERYDKNGRKISEKFYDKINENMNLRDINSKEKTEYGITVRRTPMRTFPTEEKVFKDEDRYEFDRFQETDLYPAEPLVIIHMSKDKKWYFVQMYNYCGWVKTEDVAIAAREDLHNYINSKNFIVVTGKKVRTNFNPLNMDVSELELDMGVKVPLALEEEIGDDVFGQNPAGNFIVKLPCRNKKGMMEVRLGLIPVVDDVSIGYLPYSRFNILNQAFKFIGERYGWGGTFNSRDCSGFVVDIFRTFGICLPRNAGDQETAAPGKSYKFYDTMTYEEKCKVLDGIETGTALYMNGHVMLYLNKYNEKYYAIHDFNNFFDKDENGKVKHLRVREVAIAPLNIYISEDMKKTYIDSLTSVKRFLVEE